VSKELEGIQLDKTSPDYIKLSEEIHSLTFLDGVLQLRYRSLEDLKFFYPTKSDGELREALTRASKLLKDACLIIEKFQNDKSFASEKYVDEAQIQFQEFSRLVISQHLRAANSLLLFEFSYDDSALTGQKLTEIGIFNAAALLDIRAKVRRHKSQLSFDDLDQISQLVDIFPNESSSVIKKVLLRVNELAKYCADAAQERTAFSHNLYEQAKKLIKDENPGYSEKSYSAALHYAHMALR